MKARRRWWWKKKKNKSAKPHRTKQLVSLRLYGRYFVFSHPFAFEPPTNQCSNINTLSISSPTVTCFHCPRLNCYFSFPSPLVIPNFTIILFWASDGFLIFLDVFRDVVFYFRGVNASVYMAVEEAWKLLRVLPQPDLERSGSLGGRVKIPQPLCLDPGSRLFQRAGRYKHVRCRRCCLLCLLEHWYLIN